MPPIPRIHLNSPGLFVTATDTGVGKTVASCCIINALKNKAPHSRHRAFKPFASECQMINGHLTNLDALALQQFSDRGTPLDLINPIRFQPPLAPGVAAEQENQSIDWPNLTNAIHELDQQADTMIVEGAGGLLVPLDPDHPSFTILDLAMHIGYPVLIIARATLGTLNHTTMTVKLLQQRGLSIAGIVMNHHQPQLVTLADDPSIHTNKIWLERMTGVPVLAVLPNVPTDSVIPHKKEIHPDVLRACDSIDWESLMHPAKPLV
ncbi:dethiobiotin synthase [Poriferisphaera sp. WC338]|uniref:dethiobiotin synthase n=1 Tax=Poriferisphaera sp. WC338 TaxID=3425129 RepID=UPI003D817D65